MKIEITLNKILFLVLLYPLILFVPSVMENEGFWLTAPYFFLIFLVFSFYLALKKRFVIRRDTTLSLFLFLFFISLFNFSTVRYSLPLFFVLYGILLFLVLSSNIKKTLNPRVYEFFLGLYIVLSIPFLFLSIGFRDADRFMGFVGSPTIYSGFICALFVVVSLNLKMKSLKFVIIYLITIVLVYLTKTRLLIVFLMLYPIIRELLFSRLWLNRKNIFLGFYFVTLFIYPLYNVVVELFPGLVTIRYGNKEDSSFGLRNYLYMESQKEYFNGNLIEKILGKGNEYSRNYIEKLLHIDLMPHNDYMRILLDWGFLGFLVFSVLLYKLAIKNNFTLFLSLVYMILFYSNMVFNLFLISLLIIMYFMKEKNKFI